MKKLLTVFLAASLICSSCATVFQGKITECQKLQKANKTHRQIRPGILVLDLLFGFIPAFIDIATGAIYEKQTPDCNPENSKPK